MLNTKENKIVNLIEAINDFDIKTSVEIIDSIKNDNSEYSQLLNNESYKGLLEAASKISKISQESFGWAKKEVIFDDIFDQESQQFLKEFIGTHDIVIDEKFLSLNSSKIYSFAPLYKERSYEGNEQIKFKVDKLEELSNELKCFYYLCSFVDKFDQILAIPLSVINNTTSTQNKLLLNIYINIENYYNMNSIRADDKLSSFIINSIGIERLFDPSTKYYNIIGYPYSFGPGVIGIMPPFNTQITDYLATVNNNIESMFCYAVEHIDTQYHLSIEFDDVHPEEEHSLPTYIFVKNNTKSISYEISGSHLPRKTRGKIDLF